LNFCFEVEVTLKIYYSSNFFILNFFIEFEVKFIILRKQKNHRPQFISIQGRVSEEIKMIFANYHEYKTAKEQLKVELKTPVTATVIGKISEQLQFQRLDAWGFLLDSTKPSFLKFTKGHKQDWCNKMSLVFKTAFDSVVQVVYETTNTVNIEDLHFFIDDFFNKDELFDEEWFLCSKCFKTTPVLSNDTNLCSDCEQSLYGL